MRTRASFFLLGLCAALPAGAVPSFEVLLRADSVGGALSDDGSVATLSRGSRTAPGNSGFSWVTRLDGPQVGFPLMSARDFVYNAAPSGDGKVVFAAGRSPDVAERWERTTSPDFEYAEVTFAGNTRVVDVNHDGSVHLSDGMRVTPTGTDTLGFGTEISGSGDVVVGTRNVGLDTGEAVRWENGVTVVLGDLPGGIERSFANGISSDGTTIVGFGHSENGREATRWKNGSVLSLGDLPGGMVSANALAVSGDGSVVVGLGDHDGDVEPFYWTEAGGMRNLRAVLESLGVVLPDDVDLEWATHVSNDGRRILGTGTAPNADPFGSPQELIWLATIPEPTTGCAARRRPPRPGGQPPPASSVLGLRGSGSPEPRDLREA